MSFEAPLEANEEPFATAYFGDGDTRVYFVSEVVRERNHSQHGHQYAVKYKNNQHQWWKAPLVAKRFAKFLKRFNDNQGQPQASSSSAKPATPPPEQRAPDNREKSQRRPRKRSASRPPNDQQDELDIPVPPEHRVPDTPEKKKRRSRTRSASRPRNDKQDEHIPSPSEQRAPLVPEKKQQRPRARSASRAQSSKQDKMDIPILSPQRTPETPDIDQRHSRARSASRPRIDNQDEIDIPENYPRRPRTRSVSRPRDIPIPPLQRAPENSESNQRRSRARSASRPRSDKQNEIDIPIPILSPQRLPEPPEDNPRRSRARSASRPRNDNQDKQDIPENNPRRARTRSASRPRNDKQNDPKLSLRPVVQMEEVSGHNRSITPAPSTPSQVSSGPCSDRLWSTAQVGMPDNPTTFKQTTTNSDSGNEGSLGENPEEKPPVLPLPQNEPLPNINGSGSATFIGIDVTQRGLMQNSQIFIKKLVSEVTKAFIEPALNDCSSYVAELQKVQSTLAPGSVTIVGVDVTENMLKNNLQIFLHNMSVEVSTGFVKAALGARTADITEILKLSSLLDKVKEENEKHEETYAEMKANMELAQNENKDKLAMKDMEIKEQKTKHLEALREIVGHYEETDDENSLKAKAQEMCRKYHGVLNVMQPGGRAGTDRKKARKP